MQHRGDLIGLFAHHKVAANLLMIIMIMSGIFALDRLNVQFFPSFELDIVQVRVIWTGASAEDIEDGITNPLEQRLRSTDNLDKMTSTSSQGISSITMEFKEGTDPLLALDQVRRFVDEFRNLPLDAEKPEVSLLTRYESVARLLITGLDDPAEMRNLARRFESELLDRGLDKIDIKGLPEEEIAIEVDNAQLQQLGLNLSDIAQRVADFSRDLPAGSVGGGEGARELRSLDKRRDALELRACQSAAMPNCASTWATWPQSNAVRVTTRSMSASQTNQQLENHRPTLREWRYSGGGTHSGRMARRHSSNACPRRRDHRLRCLLGISARSHSIIGA